MACLAMLSTGRHPATARAALAWLVEQKDPSGTWYSTQATVLALKALLAGTGKPLAESQAREIEITLDDKPLRKLVIPPDQAEVMQQVDLSAQVARGKRRLVLRETGGAATGYQATLRFHVPDSPKTTGKPPLAIDIRYDKTKLAVHDQVTATATVANHMAQAAPMVILDLPIPAGFTAEADALSRLVESGTIARYQLTARSVIVYLRELKPGQPLVLTYRLRATTPVKVAVPPAHAYEYYNPDHQTASASSQFTVTAASD